MRKEDLIFFIKKERNKKVIMIGLVFRGVFLISIISWYSYGVVKMINEYFRSEYKSYLTTEFKKNKHLNPNEEVPIKYQDQAVVNSFEIPTSPPNDNEEIPKLEEKFKEIKIEQHVDDDEVIVNYWLTRKKIEINRDANDGHCHIASDIKCKDN